jgi:tetratricopeptide (TPR) repeat protein
VHQQPAPDPRARGGAQAARQPGARQTVRRPEIPPDVTADQLDASVRAELRMLPRDLADLVARHLAAADQAADPEVALSHAVAARQLAARVGAVREVCGVAAYLAGHWAEALSELRAARRLTGRRGYLAMMADCERALGRLDRALALVTGPDAAIQDRAEQVELRIVESGIRRDMGAADAAVVVLQLPELTGKRLRPWSARFFYAYADALLDAGRADEAREWFSRAAAADPDGETDAAERFEELDDVIIEDLEDEDRQEPAGEPAEAGQVP